MSTVPKQPRVAKAKNGIPPRTCEVCQRPFEWRAKWRNVFDEVKYCSEKCSRQARRDRNAAGG
jgi:hypothetical protein